MVLCVFHGHQLFGIGYHFKILRSQVATGKKNVNFTPCTQRKLCGLRNILITVEAMPHSMDNFPTSVVKFRFYLFLHHRQLCLGPVHTYPEICENAIFFLRIRLASTRIQRIFRSYPEIFENALQSRNFFIQYEYVYVWTVVCANLRISLRHFLGSSLHVEHYKQTAYSKVVSSLLIALISSLISCVQINAAVIYLYNQCFRDPSRWFWRIASFCILS